LKKLGLLAFALIAFAMAMSGKPVSAIETLFTYKEVPLTIVVVPASPSAYAPNPQGAGAQVASISSYDVPMGILPPTMIGQSAQQQGAVPVKFKTIPDPTATNLHEIPINTTLTAPVGTTSYFACPFEMYAYYKTTYVVTDFGQGTSSSGTGAYPVYNYPQTSDIAWNLTAVGATPKPTYTPFANKGATGETTFTGTAGEVQTQCINIAVTVPAGFATGTYNAVIQYNLYAT
jgi:hypothetical protein